MKKSVWLVLVLMMAALSVMSVSAAPRGRYYDQNGNKYWCNVDEDGCWVTGEEGERIYIMFWSEAAAAKFMGEEVKAPIGIRPADTELTLAAPLPAGRTAPVCQPDLACPGKSEERCSCIASRTCYSKAKNRCTYNIWHECGCHCPEGYGDSWQGPGPCP